MLNIQKYLRTEKTPDNLKEDFGINYKRHNKYPNLISFKYNQIDSPKGHPIVMEARGIILDESDNWNIIAHPFNRFFNDGEGFAAKIDWDTARIYEKADGSLCIVYPYDNKWNVASSGMPDASGGINGLCLDNAEWHPRKGVSKPIPQTFAEYFWQTISLYGNNTPLHRTPAGQIKNYCFMFELMGSLNRIVVNHKEPHVVILGARNLQHDYELTPEEVYCLLEKSFPYVKEFPPQDLTTLLSSFEHMSPLSQEGYVVVDAQFNRVKIKHPGYVALHQLKGEEFTPKRCLQLIVAGETSEVLVAFPEFKPLFKRIEQSINDFIFELETEYNKIKNIENQKEFALKAIKTKCSGALFSVRSGKAQSIKEFVIKMNVNKLMILLGFKDNS